jgi:putative transposase
VPRGPRLDAPFEAHHVMLRGIDGAPLFHDSLDRESFVARLSRILPETGTRCPAWALMTNHVHLVLQTGSVRLSRVMARLNTGYARSFNLRHGRRGYVFQNRYRSRRVLDDADLIGLVRYVHANPLEARLVESLDSLARFPWCGHGALVGTRAPLPFESIDCVLRLFGRDRGAARRNLLLWMTRDEGPAPPCSGPPQQREVEGGSVATPGDDRAASPRNDAEPEEMLNDLIDGVCRWAGLPREEVLGRQRIHRVVRARAAIAQLAVARCGIPGTAVSAALGISAPAVSQLLRRGEEALRELGLDPETQIRVLAGASPRARRGEAERLDC